jgi:hypothetical protein
MVSSDVQQEGHNRLNDAGLVRPGRVAAETVMGLQAGGRGFESRTLHLKKVLACRAFPLPDAIVDNAGASVVRADLSVPVRRCRVGQVRSSEVR